MNSKKLYITLLVVLAAVIIGAAAGYRAYTGRQQNAPAGEASAAAEKDSEAVSSTASESVDTGVTPLSETEDAASAGTASDVSSPEASEETAEEELPDAADFTVETAEGMEVRLADMLGKPVIVNFWASWCPPCKAELPYFEEASSEYGDRIRFMMVDLTDGSRETDTTVQQFMKETGYTFPVFYDRQGSASYAYELYSIPVTVGITAEGKLYYQKTGAMQSSELQSLIDHLLES